MGIATFHYVSLSIAKCPRPARRRVAIVSFLIAGWLVMLSAEVVDHYGACLRTEPASGAFVSYKWIFVVDRERCWGYLRQPGAGRMLSFGFWVLSPRQRSARAAGTRLVIDN